MNKPTHEEISRRAHKIWQDAGRSGGAEANWRDAERQLREEASQGSARSPAPEQATPVAANTLSNLPAEAESAERRTKEARAPQTPNHVGPRPTPAETGKPLYRRPHSS